MKGMSMSVQKKGNQTPLYIYSLIQLTFIEYDSSFMYYIHIYLLLTKC